MAPTYPELQDALTYPARERTNSAACRQGIEAANRVLAGAPPLFMGDGTIGNWLYQAYGVPWVKNDANERLKNATAVEYEALVADR